VLDPLLGEVSDGVVRPGRAELTAAMRAPSVVVRLVPGQDQPQVSFAENQHPVCDLRPGGEYEPFGIGVRPGASGRNLHRLDPGAGQRRIEGCGELPGPVAEEEPDVGGEIAEVHQEIADLLRRPRLVRVRGDPEDVHAAAADLDHPRRAEGGVATCPHGAELAAQPSDPCGYPSGIRARRCWPTGAGHRPQGPVGMPIPARNCAPE